MSNARSDTDPEENGQSTPAASCRMSVSFFWSGVPLSRESV